MSNYSLEEYLSVLEKSLSQLSVADRAVVVTDGKNLIEEKIHHGASFKEVITELGPPKKLAKYLVTKRGFELPVKPQSLVFKWLMISVLGVVFMLSLTIAFLAWKFSPIYQVDAQTGRMQFFGGAIDIMPGEMNWQFQSGSGATFTIEERKVNIAQKSINIYFKNGTSFIANLDNDDFSYKCEVSLNEKPVIQETDSEFLFDFSNLDGVCHLGVPMKSLLYIKGENGMVTLSELHNSVKIDLGNGTVSVKPDTREQYQYSLSVEKGSLDTFDHSFDQNAYKLEVNLGNGMIRKIN